MEDVLDIYDSLPLDELNNLASSKTKRLVDKSINELDKNLLNDQFLALKLNSMGRSYTNFQAEEVLLIIAYLKRLNSLKEVSHNTFEEVAKDIYRQAKEEIPFAIPLDLEWVAISHLAIITGLNISYDDYLALLTQTNFEETLRLFTSVSQIEQEIEQPLEKLVDKQAKRIINVHDDKHSGVLHDTSITVGNGIYLESMGDKDCDVQFIATVDDRTSEMCLSLHEQKFSTKEINEFSRYFASSGFTKVRIKGLITGINQPPITDNVHHCRSTIVFLKTNE